MSTERSAVNIFDERTGDRDAERILEALRGRPDGMSRREIRRTLFGGNKPAEVINSMLASLQGLGLVQSERVETGGRPAERWHAISALNAESPPAVAISPLPFDPAPVATLETSDPPPDVPLVEPAPLLPPPGDDPRGRWLPWHFPPGIDIRETGR
jgi:hypothetical protein